jgi:Tol biopolymer transport system component
MVQGVDSNTALELVERASVPIAWSPDGNKIFFDAGREGIKTVFRGGGEPEKVIGGAFFFDLSPDGKTLALWKVVRSQDKVRGSVWLSSPVGAEPREYLPAPFAVPASYVPVYLRFSPNGRMIYLSGTAANGVNETWLLPLPPGSSPPRRLFPKISWSLPVAASWMPDSRHLVLSSNMAPRGSYSLWLGDIQTSSLSRLDDSSNDQTEPAVSPDGKRLLLTRQTFESDIYELPLDGSPHKLLATTLPEFSPSWSPKGDQFAYVTQRSGTVELWVHSKQGNWDRPVVTGREIEGLGNLGAPAISPDGTRVVYMVLARQLGIYISPVDGGTPALLVPRSAGPSWSPDGTSIAFVWINAAGISRLATLRLGANSQPFDIAPDECSLLPPQWSPSGDWIACDAATGLMLFSPDGKQKRMLPRLDASVMAWSGDSRTIYGLAVRNGRLKLLAEDIGTGATREVADYGADLSPYSGRINRAQRMSLSPDGRSFAVGLGGVKSDLWILEGFVK